MVKLVKPKCTIYFNAYFYRQTKLAWPDQIWSLSDFSTEHNWQKKFEWKTAAGVFLILKSDKTVLLVAKVDLIEMKLLMGD